MLELFGYSVAFIALLSAVVLTIWHTPTAKHQPATLRQRQGISQHTHRRGHRRNES